MISILSDMSHTAVHKSIVISTIRRKSRREEKEKNVVHTVAVSNVDVNITESIADYCQNGSGLKYSSLSLNKKIIKILFF